MTNVLFNNARGAASSLQMSPPFAFSDVTMSVFPLRASLPSLENFCRNYLNQAPNLVQFRPFVPFVYLVILDYGRMSLEAANMGWVSQREVAFGIPLRWLNAGEKGLEFHDWAFSSPFIFVDNELSMSTGREVYGWPKLLARLDPSVSEWVRDPHGARRVFQVSTKGTAEAYAGQTSEYRPLLSVFQHRTAGLLDVPPSMDALVKPLSQMSDTVTSLTRLGADLAKTFVGMASDRITGSAVLPDMMDVSTFRDQLSPQKMQQWRSVDDWLPGVKDALWSLFPRMYANTINFKQFRDAANPHGTCYQALTAARMPVKSFKQGGFLGPQNMLLGQMDGGFRIDIHHLAGLPIVESLGLEVSEERRMGENVVSSVTPVAPLWMKVDMTYGLAETLIWRGRADKWTVGAGLEKARAETAKARAQSTVVTELIRDAVPDVIKGGGTAEHDQNPRAGADDAPDEGKAPNTDDTPDEFEDGQGFDYIRAMNFFNTSRGASEAVGGSFLIPNASVRVLPLKADAQTLQSFVRDYLKVEQEMRFEAWGDFVYLVISDFKQMNSEFSAISKRRARELSLLVPVKAYKWFGDGDYIKSGHAPDCEENVALREKRGEEKLLTTGFVNAFTYVDDVETAITLNEVFGVPSMGSFIKASENEWLSRDQSKEHSQHEILQMTAQVLPALSAGAQAVERTLVDLSTHHPHHPMVQESVEEAVNNWVGVLADDLEEKIGQSETQATRCGQGFALKLLGGDASFNQFSLKQFRDSSETNTACYQGLIQRRHTIEKLTDFREIEAPIHVSITDYPTQPITTILGLKPKYSYPGRDRLVRVFEAVRPFSLNGDLRRGAGVTLFERVNSEKWRLVDVTEEAFGWVRLPQHESAACVASLPKDARCEVAFEYDKPDTGQAAEKHLKSVSKKRLAYWIDNWLATGKARDFKIRFRTRKDMVSVLHDPFAGAVEPPRDVNLAAWNAQMRDKETGFSQAQMAREMEKFNPATVIDKVLSQRWGISSSNGLPRFNKADYCIPVSAIPDRFGAALFPHTEQLNGYWPHSVAHYEHLKGQRKSDFFAFKVELNTAVRTFALFYPDLLMRNLEPDKTDGPIDVLMTAFSEALYSFVDGDVADEAKKTTRRTIEQIESTDDHDELRRATEKMVIQFFDVHLPPIFSLVPDKGALSYAEVFSSGGKGRQASIEEWKGARKGFREVSDIIRKSIGDDETADEIINEILMPFIIRTEENIAYLEAGGPQARHGVAEPAVPELIERPYELLRARMHEAILGQT